MKILRFGISSVVLVFFLLVVAFTQSGCEEADGVGSLQVDPSSTTLSTNNVSVVLSVVGGITNNTLALPLTWEVSNASLGRITASSGMTAVYTSTSAGGVNSITVRDQFKREGYATITQQIAASGSYSLSLTADSSAIESNQGATISINGDSAVAPFTWKLESGPGSLAAGSGSRSAAYSAGGGTGVAQITVTDGNGVAASISITVTEVVVDDGSGDGGTTTPPDLGI